MDNFTYKGYDVEIHQDDSDHLWDDLRDNNDGHMDYFTTYGKWGGYELFDVEGGSHSQYSGKDDWLLYINSEYDVIEVDEYDISIDGLTEKQETRIQKWIDKNLFILPIYVYEHGGITMSTGGYGCQWDSGQAGYIFSDKKRALELTGKKKMNKAIEKKIYSAMERRIKYVAALCEGSVYGYTWDYGGCGGYVVVDYKADTEYIVNEVKSEIDYHIKKEVSDHLEHRKKQIKQHIPEVYRQPLTL